MSAHSVAGVELYSGKGVLVIGGGVAGIQASLDLAKAGARVYLVERSASLGGRMAQLDKTLPTNDCSICILSPMLVECARHTGIQVLTLSELKSVSGWAGDFTVEVLRHPRYVDPKRCTACGDCEKVCPVARPSEFEAGLARRKAIYRPYPQAVPNLYAIEKHDRSPCSASCPAGINAHGYVALAADGRFIEAYRVITDTMPFPSVCGRVCYAPCEDACNRRSVDQAVAIRALKRFVSDYYWAAGGSRGRGLAGDSLGAPQAEAADRDGPDPAVGAGPITDKHSGGDALGRISPSPRRECASEVIPEPVDVAGPVGLAVAEPEEALSSATPAGAARVAIVGSGPAGLTAAWKLVRMGYRPTVFEAQSAAGGMLRLGIPRFRLPASVLDREIGAIADAGVDIRLNHRVDDLASLFASGYRAVLVALGAHDAPQVGLKGESMARVVHAIDFLRDVSLGKTRAVPARVVVVGGGNAAVDAARTAVRLGARTVTIAYRRSRDEMPAYPSEVQAALDEGVEISFLTSPRTILGGKDGVSGIRLVRTRLGEPDASGRRSPVEIDGSEHDLGADMVILAVSQAPSTDWLRGVVEIKGDGTLSVDPASLATSYPGVFGAGDAAGGPYTVADAIGSGLRAAESIHRHLAGTLGRSEPEPRPEKEPVAGPPPGTVDKKYRVAIPTLSPEARGACFDEVEGTLGAGDAVCEASRCLNCSVCSSCMECVRACEPDAIVHDDKPETLALRVGAVVVATGFDEMDPSALRNLGYSDFEDVLTGLEFERLLSAAGPTRGKIRRPSDGTIPESIAFIQCVGSRDERHSPYCSRVCCVYSVKQCMVAKEHEPAIRDLVYFYRDLRAYGRGFEEFCLRGRDQTGIRFIRSSPAAVARTADGKLRIQYELPQSARPESVEVDMVVLACAMRPSEGTRSLASVLGIEVEPDGFFKAADALGDPVSSTRDGVFVCGCASGPKDIPDSVAQASAASAKALALLDAADRQPPAEKALPQNDPSEAARIGVFVCHCGLNIAGVVDSKGVAEYAAGLPGVVCSADNLYTCSDDAQRKIQELIRANGLNRVVVAACTPRTHEAIFRQTCAQAGLNPYLFEMANIRDQCSWVHAADPKAATAKARDLVRMAVARAGVLIPLERKRVEVERAALVVGGGISGIQCAIDLARIGVRVCLAEQGTSLGGTLRDLGHLSPTGIRAGDLVARKAAELQSLPVEILLGAEIESVNGFVGNFDVAISGRRLKVGALVLATGGTSFAPAGRMGHGRWGNVVSSAEFEKVLARTPAFAERTEVVFVQCVGARDPQGYTGCSRYCCQVTLKQALEALDRGAGATVIHKDVRAFTRYGEGIYRAARQRGVRFLRMREDALPALSGNGSVASVRLFDETLGAEVELDCHLLVLAVPLLPGASTAALSEMLRIPRGRDGFFLERHVKLGPLETNTEGIFLCGCAQYPKDVPDSLAQASGVAAKVAGLLSKPYLTLDPATASVCADLCRACGICVDICEYRAPEIATDGPRRYAVINPALCKGCGTCASACPTGAIVAKHYTDPQIEAMIDSLLGG